MNATQCKRLLGILIFGAVLWFLPHPTEVTNSAWHLFALFAAVIVGFVLQPLPLGAVATIGITVATLLGIVSVKTAISGFGNSTIWLIICAFLLSRAFIKSGLGSRIAYLIIRAIGRSSLRLGYAIALTDLIISPALPSATARAGGIIFPIIRSLSTALGSEPTDGTRKKFGAFIMQLEYQANCITSSIFLTAMSANLLAVALASQTMHLTISWGMWALAAIVPGLLSLFVMPPLLYYLFPPEIHQLPKAKQMADDALCKMGSVL